MKTIPSFTIDHTKLLRGVYVSTYQSIGDEMITTFDIRLRRPNTEPVLNTGEIHAIEHIGAIFLRNSSKAKSDIIYFGPMGCRTGFYLLMKGMLKSVEIIPLMIELFYYISNFEGDIPGATPIGCGNFGDMNLDNAKEVSSDFLLTLQNISKTQLNYP